MGKGHASARQLCLELNATRQPSDPVVSVEAVDREMKMLNYRSEAQLERAVERAQNEHEQQVREPAHPASAPLNQPQARPIAAEAQAAPRIVLSRPQVHSLHAAPTGQWQASGLAHAAPAGQWRAPGQWRASGLAHAVPIAQWRPPGLALTGQWRASGLVHAAPTGQWRAPGHVSQHQLQPARVAAVRRVRFSSSLLNCSFLSSFATH